MNGQLFWIDYNFNNKNKDFFFFLKNLTFKIAFY